jgi:hypothetical protein
MFMVAMPVAIEVAAVRVAMHMAMMMAVPVVPIDNVVRQLHDPASIRSG